jgi:hypothetical protein
MNGETTASQQQKADNNKSSTQKAKTYTALAGMESNSYNTETPAMSYDTLHGKSSTKTTHMKLNARHGNARSTLVSNTQLP